MTTNSHEISRFRHTTQWCALAAVCLMVLACAPSLTMAQTSGGVWQDCNGRTGTSWFDVQWQKMTCFAAGVVTGVQEKIVKIVDQGLESIVAGAFDLFSGIFHNLVTIEISLILFFINPHNFQFASSALVHEGWVMSLQIANVILVLGLLILANKMILGLENYGDLKKIIGYLTTAIFINFSLAIASLAIGVSNMLTLYFLNLASAPTDANPGVVSIENIGDRISQSFGVFEALIQEAPNFLSSSVLTVFAAFFGLVMWLVVFCIFGAIAWFLFVRVIKLWLYLIVLPIAYVLDKFGFSVPGVSNAWTKWKDGFMSCLVFPPLMAFVLWFTFVFMNRAQSLYMDPATVTGTGFIASLLQSGLFLALLIMGYNIASSTSGSSLGIFDKWIKQLAPTTIAGWGKQPIVAGIGGQIRKGASQVGQWAASSNTGQRFVRALETNPVLSKVGGKWVAGKVQQQVGARKERLSKKTQEAESTFTTLFEKEGISPKELLDKVNDTSLSEDVRVGALEALMKNSPGFIAGNQKDKTDAMKAMGRTTEDINRDLFKELAVYQDLSDRRGGKFKMHEINAKAVFGELGSRVRTGTEDKQYADVMDKTIASDPGAYKDSVNKRAEGRAAAMGISLGDATNQVLQEDRNTLAGHGMNQDKFYADLNPVLFKPGITPEELRNKIRTMDLGTAPQGIRMSAKVMEYGDAPIFSKAILGSRDKPDQIVDIVEKMKVAAPGSVRAELLRNSAVMDAVSRAYSATYSTRALTFNAKSFYDPARDFNKMDATAVYDPGTGAYTGPDIEDYQKQLREVTSRSGAAYYANRTANPAKVRILENEYVTARNTNQLDLAKSIAATAPMETLDIQGRNMGTPDFDEKEYLETLENALSGDGIENYIRGRVNTGNMGRMAMEQDYVLLNEPRNNKISLARRLATRIPLAIESTAARRIFLASMAPNDRRALGNLLTNVQIAPLVGTETARTIIKENAANGQFIRDFVTGFGAAYTLNDLVKWDATKHGDERIGEMDTYRALQRAAVPGLPI